MVDIYEVTIRLLLGTLIGGIIGFERQVHGRPAGLRTHILVCVACVLLMLVSAHYHALGVQDPGYVRADPGRIAAGAITGVGFLGAGVILKTGFSIQGLTTAASIWVISAIGLAVGAGLYAAGIITFFVTGVTLTFLRIMEKKVPKLSFRYLTIKAGLDASEEGIRAVLKKHGAKVSNFGYQADSESGETIFSLTVAYYRTLRVKPLVDELTSLPSVKKVTLAT